MKTIVICIYGSQLPIRKEVTPVITRIDVRKWETALAPNSNHHSHSAAGALAAAFRWEV